MSWETVYVKLAYNFSRVLGATPFEFRVEHFLQNSSLETTASQFRVGKFYSYRRANHDISALDDVAPRLPL